MTRCKRHRRVARTGAEDAEIQADIPDISTNEILGNQPRTARAHARKADSSPTPYQGEQPRQRREIGQRVNPPHHYALTFLW